MSSKTVGRARLLIFLVLATSLSATYVDDARKSLRDAFGQRKEFPNYEFYGSPVGNFGVGAIFTGDVRNGTVTTVKKAWLIGEPNSFWVNTVTDKEKEELLKQLFPEGPMGTRTLTDDIFKSLGIEGTASVVAKLLGGKVNFSKEVKVELTKAKATNRLMNWDVFSDLIAQNKIRPSIGQRLKTNEKTIAVVAGDIVLAEYQIKVTLNPQKDGQLNQNLIELTATKPGSSKPFVSLTAKQTQTGVFELNSTEPLVVARMLLRPPDDGALRGTEPPGQRKPEDQWSNWQRTKPQESILKKLFELQRQ